MNNYLSRIASRSIPNNTPALMPATPFITNNSIDPFQNIGNNQNLFNPAPDSLLADKKNVQDKSIMPLVNERINQTTPSPKRNYTEKGYITKYIERVLFKDDGTKQQSVKVKGITEDNFSTGRNHGPDKITNGIIRDTKDTTGIQINPVKDRSDERSGHDENKRAGIKTNNAEQMINNPKETRLNPVPPSLGSPASKTTKVAPKLVIGKISVEILPADVAKPTKIITRVVQAPTSSNSSKTNILSFGLGQM